MQTSKKRILLYLWSYRWYLLCAVVQIFLIGGLQLLKPWPFKFIIDNVINEKPLSFKVMAGISQPNLLLIFCLTLFLIYLSSAILTFLNKYTTLYVGKEMVKVLREELYHHLQKLSLSFHGRLSKGDLLYRVTTDADEIQSLIINGFLPMLSALILVVSMFMVLFHLDAHLSLIVLSVGPVLLICLVPINKWISSAAGYSRYQASKVYALIQSAMSNMHVIQAFTQEEQEYQRFASANQGSLSANFNLYLFQSFYGGVSTAVLGLWASLIIWVGARHVLSGLLSVGELVVFFSYLAFLLISLHQVNESWGTIQGSRVGVARAFELLKVENDLQDGTQVFAPSDTRVEIAFCGVSFHYLCDQPVLRDINLKIQPGEKVAIVGSTGAGKSTLVSLLPRFYDPQIGQVTIDGVDIREYQLKSLRHQISMVLQPPLVFPLTIRENIAYGRPQATLNEIIRAAKVAHLHDFITKLPNQYETKVEEQGFNLSEGQKQRLTIARAVLRNSPILILDEPTSAMDAETEASVVESLNNLMKGKTVLMIAHRFSTIRKADQIVVMENGQIIEQGNFEQLMSLQGVFNSLYQTQT
ncbi:MAG: ABC transporter ATP-binding protein, partial [Moorea sp. SIO4E2]|uniref:ABC transporter ATP-binding protein n=1 Tax=Moorena sp. SIO4E2 TaxID=2607826 RepID=UPI0013B5BE91